MEFVQPIRDLVKIEAMKRHLLGGPNGLRNHLLFTLGINSGLRISDLLSLKVGDVADNKGKPVGRIILRESKTGKEKNFKLGKQTMKLIKEYIVSLGKPAPDQSLFASKKGGSISRHMAWRILNDAAEAVGIQENVGTHTLRKTFGYHAYQRGVDIVLLQDLLNHSAPSITLRYIGITQDQKDRVYEALDL
jgi:site-specific recombinase XerD